MIYGSMNRPTGSGPGLRGARQQINAEYTALKEREVQATVLERGTDLSYGSIRRGVCGFLAGLVMERVEAQAALTICGGTNPQMGNGLGLGGVKREIRPACTVLREQRAPVIIPVEGMGV